MMRRFLIITALSALIFVAVTSMTSKIYEHAQERRVIYNYFSEALPPQDEMLDSVRWGAPTKALLKAFSKADQQRVGKVLSNAWITFAAAQKTGETVYLEDYFSGPALGRAASAAQTAHGAQTFMVLLTLESIPEFLQTDKTLLQLKQSGLAVRFALKDEKLTFFHPTRDTNITTLLSDNTGWKVYAHERLSAEPIAPFATQNKAIPRLAGVNYYPAQTPWRMFWPAFDPSVIEQDFKQISALGANAIRIFLQRDMFLGTAAKQNSKNLQALLDTAAQHQLYVIPTLFDLKGDYQMSKWMEDALYLQTVAPILARHDAVAFVDLKNEPDLDFEHHGQGNVLAWAQAMAVVHRTLAPDVPLTVGWAAAEQAKHLTEVLDVITYHDYAPLEGTAQRLTQVQMQANGKPVMITEIGNTSWSALFSFPGSPEKQAQHLSNRISGLARADGVLVWTLHDFPNPDSTAIGHSPWVRRIQSHFGLLDAEQNLKPAGQVARSYFNSFLTRTLK